MKKLHRFIGMPTAITLKDASRLNPIVDDPTTTPGGSDWVAIDNTGMTLAIGNTRNKIVLLVTNTEAVNTLTVTQTVYASVAGITVPDETYTIPTGDTAVIGPIDHPDLQQSDTITLAFSSAGTPAGNILAVKVDANNA